MDHHAKIYYSQTKVLPTREKGLPVHLGRLHELVDGDGDLRPEGA